MRPSVKTVLGVVRVVVLSGALTAPPARAQSDKTIVDVAIAAGSFKTLVAAVQAADLVEVLKRPGPLTVLAPTDEAFAKIPKADLDALMKDKAKLAKVLQYVLTGNVALADLKMMKDFGTGQGGRGPRCSPQGESRRGELGTVVS